MDSYESATDSYESITESYESETGDVESSTNEHPCSGSFMAVEYFGALQRDPPSLLMCSEGKVAVSAPHSTPPRHT